MTPEHDTQAFPDSLKKAAQMDPEQRWEGRGVFVEMAVLYWNVFICVVSELRTLTLKMDVTQKQTVACGVLPWW